VARWLLNNREQLLQYVSRVLEVSPAPQFPGLVAVTGSEKGLDVLLGGEKPGEKEA
jgi:hypothetical protein